MIQDLNMKTFFYTVSVIMVIVWALSYFVYAINASIHLLLLSALLLGVAGLLEKEKEEE